MTNRIAMVRNSTALGLGSNRGAVLIIVLWSVAMMSVIVVALSTFARKSTLEAGIDADIMRTEFALYAGVEVGKAIIVSRPLEQRAFFDGTEIKADIGGGRQANISIMDAAGLVDINRADTKLIENVAAAAGFTAGQAKALAEQIGSLRKKNAPASESQTQQTQSDSDSTAKITPVFFSVAQLSQLTGASTAAMEQLMPLLGVYGSTGKLNPLAAPSMVLESVPGITTDDLQAFASARQSSQWQANQTITEALARLANHITIAPPNSFVIEVVLLSTDGILAGRRIRTVVVLRSDKASAFQTLALSW